MRNTNGSLGERSRGETYTANVHTPHLHTSVTGPNSLQLLHLGAVAQLGEHLPCTPPQQCPDSCKTTKPQAASTVERRNPLPEFRRFSYPYVHRNVHTASLGGGENEE